MTLPSQDRQLLREPRLAYSGLPPAQHDARTSLLRGHQVIGKRSQLPVTSNKGTAHPLNDIRPAVPASSPDTVPRMSPTRFAGSVSVLGFDRIPG